MNEIKLVALDIDDTLVDHSSVLSERNKRALQAAMAAGVYVVLSTGRATLGAKMINDQITTNAPVICYGGGVIMDPNFETILKSRYMDPADVRLVIETGYAMGLHVQIYQGDDVVFKAANEFTHIYTSVQRLPWHEEPDMPDCDLSNVPKVLMFAMPDVWLETAAKLREMLPAHLNVLVSKKGFIEIGDAHCTKGTALGDICAMLNVPRENSAAIGDNTLDESMIIWAGTGCCVENGNPHTKDVADLILPSCQEDGVAWFIENYVFSAERKAR